MYLNSEPAAVLYEHLFKKAHLLNRSECWKLLDEVDSLPAPHHLVVVRHLVQQNVQLLLQNLRYRILLYLGHSTYLRTRYRTVREKISATNLQQIGESGKEGNDA